MSSKANYDDFAITEKLTPDLWSQLEDIVEEHYNNKEAALLALSKLPGTRIAFLVREADNVLLSALGVTFTKSRAFTSFVMTRKGYRSAGFGMFLICYFYEELKKSSTKFIGKMRPYGRETTKPLGQIYSIHPKNLSELLSLFPPHNNNFDVMPMDKLSPEILTSLVKFASEAAGADRTVYLQHLLPTARGAVLLNLKREVIGYVTARQSGNSAYKWLIAPLQVDDAEAAGALMENLASQIGQDMEFAFLCSEEPMGKYLLQKAKEMGIKARLDAAIVDLREKVEKFRSKFDKHMK